MINRLLPCPFCGGTHISIRKNGIGWHICCQECVMGFSTLAPPAEMWNRRPGEEKLQAENARLRDELASLEHTEAEGDQFRDEYHRQMQEQIDKLRAVIEQVEYVAHHVCPWCKGSSHKPNCPRQAELGLEGR